MANSRASVAFAAPSPVRTFGAAARVPTVVPAVVTGGLRAPSGADGYLVAVPAEICAV